MYNKNNRNGNIECQILAVSAFLGTGSKYIYPFPGNLFTFLDYLYCMRIFPRRNNAHVTEAGDRITDLYDRYAPRFLGLCYRYCGNPEDAEDIMHDGFLNIIRNLNRFEHRGEGSMEAWMKKIMINTALKYLRDNAKYKKLLVFEPDGGDVILADNLENGNYPEVSKEQLLDLITELPLGYRTVFNFYVMENYSHKEIADLLKFSENTSKSQLAKARAWLKKRILQLEKKKEYEQNTASFR